MGKLILLLGGARSGKSSAAQKLASALEGPVVYIATAQALDEEMQGRIAVHRQERPADWETLELPSGIVPYLRGRELHAQVFLLDCLTMLMTNLIMAASPDVDAPDEQAAAAAVNRELQELIGWIQNQPGTWIIVSNEVGLGLVPPYPLGRIYRDLLGWANQRLAAAADEVLFLIAGIPVPLHAFRLARENG